MATYTTRIGHVHLKVRDLARSVAFYTRTFNLKIVETVANYAFLTGGDMHHEIALQALGSGAPIPSRGAVGLYHIAFEVPDARAFALAYQLLKGDGVPVGAVDHGISWAMYFPDPDGNGLEIYWDTRHLIDHSTQWNGINTELSDAQILSALKA
ncbi:MAG: VOC family protein [Armatimonadetes bacterium]|nr:VOC family protein [Anaerolineae bacterium]